MSYIQEKKPETGPRVSKQRECSYDPPAVRGEQAIGTAITFGNGQVLDAGFTATDQSVLIELLQFLAIAAVPSAADIMRSILEARGHTIVAESPQILDESIIELAFPFFNV